MIKFICNHCNNEFTPDKMFLEGQIMEKKPMILPGKGKQDIFAEQSIRQLIHLCPICVTFFRQWLETKEK
ncbi:MAG: hypothetical protein DDT22_00895 [candidate division WS2 bacterium]|nr:hypothetical protein [Candidatus Lithacetigena glycinireducens]